LQRRLAALLQQGIIRTTGRGLSLVYHLVSAAEKPAEEQVSASVPLSAEGLAIQRLLQQPEGNRIPEPARPAFKQPAGRPGGSWPSPHLCRRHPKIRLHAPRNPTTDRGVVRYPVTESHRHRRPI
jgi:hypothetical protein